MIQELHAKSACHRAASSLGPRVRLGVKREHISVSDREVNGLRSAPIDLERQVVLATGDGELLCLSVSDLPSCLAVDDDLVGSEAVRIARVSDDLQ